MAAHTFDASTGGEGWGKAGRSLTWSAISSRTARTILRDQVLENRTKQTNNNKIPKTKQKELSWSWCLFTTNRTLVRYTGDAEKAMNVTVITWWPIQKSKVILDCSATEGPQDFRGLLAIVPLPGHSGQDRAERGPEPASHCLCLPGSSRVLLCAPPPLH